MKRDDRIALIKTLQTELNYKRFVHTLGVASTAACLAMCYGADVEKAELAGLLHDCAKCLDLKKMVKLCDKAGYELSDVERESSSLCHSKAGAVLAQEQYGVDDEEILNAIRFHTTGRPGMSLMEKIIFIADYMEPGRDVASDLPQVRALAFSNIDDCLMTILHDTLVYLNSSGREVDPMTRKTYDYYQDITEERNMYE